MGLSGRQFAGSLTTLVDNCQNRSKSRQDRQASIRPAQLGAVMQCRAASAVYRVERRSLPGRRGAILWMRPTQNHQERIHPLRCPRNHVLFRGMSCSFRGTVTCIVGSEFFGQIVKQPSKGMFSVPSTIILVFGFVQGHDGGPNSHLRLVWGRFLRLLRRQSLEGSSFSVGQSTGHHV